MQNSVQVMVKTAVVILRGFMAAGFKHCKGRIKVLTRYTAVGACKLKLLVVEKYGF
jgi:hypothetical protein